MRLHKKALVNALITIVSFIVALVIIITLFRDDIQRYYSYTDKCNEKYGEKNWHFEDVSNNKTVILGWEYECMEGQYLWQSQS